MDHFGELEDFHLPDLVSVEELGFGNGEEDEQDVGLDLDVVMEEFWFGEIGGEEQDLVLDWEDVTGVEDALETRPFDPTSDCVRECSICMEEFAEQVEISSLPCSHVFHRGCVFTWLQHRRTCPLFYICLYAYSMALHLLPARTELSASLQADGSASASATIWEMFCRSYF